MGFNLFLPLSYLRLEVNLSNLESENQVLRQQALEASKNDELSEEVKKWVFSKKKLRF